MKIAWIRLKICYKYAKYEKKKRRKTPHDAFKPIQLNLYISNSKLEKILVNNTLYHKIIRRF